VKLLVVPVIAFLGWMVVSISTLKLICTNQTLTVVEVGGCHSDRNGGGSCGAMLSDGSYARLNAPVKGEVIVQCAKSTWFGEIGTSYERAN
jgi:hypothetical protein